MEKRRRGPKTPKGKAMVRANAVQHGIMSVTPVIPGVETEEEWEAHLEGIKEDLQVTGPLETALGELVALYLWRLQRAARFEHENVLVEQRMIPHYVAERALAEREKLTMEPKNEKYMEYIGQLMDRLVMPEEKKLQLLMRYEAHVRRLLFQTLHELEAMQGRRRGEPTPLARLDLHGLGEGSGNGF